jgi:hypothetical protein
METENKLYFSSDYMEGAHPAIIQRLVQTNMEQTAGYGTDEYCERARSLIRKVCNCPDAAVHFLVGGTQTNATVIDALLNRYEGVIAAQTGHVAVHEAGAIEFGGHKVLPITGDKGKITAAAIEHYLRDFYADGNYEHMVHPGMVYISQPTEYGTLYTKQEITAISTVCRKYRIPLYVDGARLAYALACKENDATLADLTEFCDAFYIGGTKCGALFGEAVVIPDPKRSPHFFTIMKQHGALLAKGRLLGIQFETLFTDDLYLHIGDTAIRAADTIRAFLDSHGYEQYFTAPTNQIFIVLENTRYAELSQKIAFGFWEKKDDSHTVVRIATDWATTDENVTKLLQALA